ncbi:MAG: PfkB family carbohydrate kinase [Promethearchaeota archaeon]
MYQIRNEYDRTIESINSITKKFDLLKEEIPKKRCFLGWDGFVDHLYTVIQSRESLGKWIPIETMKNFGNLIKKVAGSSMGINVILKRKTTGGFTSNVCKCINNLGAKLSLACAWGFPKLSDVFKDYLESRDAIDVNSFTNPGITTGLEFNDGKIMLSDIESILKINWDLIKERYGIEKLLQKFEENNLVGLGYWAVIMQFEDILHHIVAEILPSISNLKDKLLFFDLADVKRRTKKDLIDFLKFLPKVEESIPLLLSLNDQEAKDIIYALHKEKILDIPRKKVEDLTEAGIFINKFLNLSYIVIHSPHFATITTRNDHYWVTEGFTSNPRYTTSAGDHFNAGTVLGLACTLPPADAILMGNAITAIFVRTGKSPTFQDFNTFIQNYMDYIKSDNPNFP